MDIIVIATLKSFAATVLKGTLSLLVEIGQGYVADKLKDGDVVDQKLCSWIVNKVESIKSKLDAAAQSDLKTSFSLLKEGFIFLNTVLDKDQSCDDSTEISDEGHEAERSLRFDFDTSAARLRCYTSFSTREMKNLQISNLENSKSEALLQAKERFKEARVHATKAFHNNALPILDRVLAMNVRVAATILARLENPAVVLLVCQWYLGELHRMREVKENFRVAITKSWKARFKEKERGQIISTVCQINRLVYDVTKVVGGRKEVLLWPYIEVDNEKIDPLRDSRVVRTLREQNMDHCCLTWSFGQQGDEEHQSLKSATGIATNSLGHFLVIDKVDGSIKVFDTTGKFLSSFTVRPPARVVGKPKLKSLATDSNDNVYVLQVTTIPSNTSKCFINEMFVLKKSESDSSQSKFDCGELDVKAKIVRVMHDHGLLFLGVERDSLDSPGESLMDWDYLVYKYEMPNESGANRATIENRAVLIGMSNLVDILVTSDNQAMILDSDCVYVIRDCKSKFHLDKTGTDKQFEVLNARAIAYHQISEQIFIVSHSENPEVPSLVLIYNKDGTFDRGIHFEVDKNYRIKGVSVTRDGVICISAHLKDPPKGKVIVL